MSESGVSADTQFIIDLVEATESYGNDQSYHGTAGEYIWALGDQAGQFEEGQQYYNSNSFAAGVIKAAGGEVPDPWYVQPGLGQPVPLEATAEKMVEPMEE